MSRQMEETVGVRYTGWAALNRDPQENLIEFTCPRCGQHGAKPTQREFGQYHFADGLLQDLEGESTACDKCRTRLRVTPVVLVHDKEQKRRFEAIFTLELTPEKN